ncbi:MAG: hypothetical protein ACSHYF_10205 [Verrucomicrobiaceae bacterium]
MFRFWLSVLFAVGVAGAQEFEEEESFEEDPEYVNPDFMMGPGLDGIPQIPQTFEEAVELFTNGSLRDSSSEGFDFSMRVQETFNSNPRISQTNASGVFYTSLSPGVSYRSAPKGRAVFVVGASYNPRLNFYHGGAIADNTDHLFNATASYEGAKTWVTFGTTFNLSNDSNRLAEDFARNTTLGVSLSGRHEWSAKTQILGDVNFTRRENSISPLSNNSGLGASVSALWEATPLLSVGPSLRYASTDSDSTGGFDSVGLLARADYDYSAKTNLSMNLGAELVSADQPGIADRISPTGSIRLDYELDDIWSFRGDLAYESISIDQLRNRELNRVFGNDVFEQNAGALGSGDQALSGALSMTYSPSDEWEAWASLRMRNSPSMVTSNESLEDRTFSLGVRRFFGLSHASLSYSQSTTDFINSQGLVGRPGQEYRVIFLSYSHPSLWSGISISTNLSHSENLGGRSFKQTTASVSLNYRF